MIYMIKKVIAPLWALTRALLSALLAISLSTERVHASAHTLRDRTAARRALRGGQPVSNRIILPRSVRSTPATRRQARLNRRSIRRIEVPEIPVVTGRRESTSTLSTLSRREQRRARRLAERPISLRQQVIDAVNLERAKFGLAPLLHHNSLEISAQEHARDMKVRNFFSHENPEEERSGDRIKKTGYGVVNAQTCRCSYKVYLGENIAKGQDTVEQVIEEWMASVTHREAMLSEDYDEIGVGILNDIWVLNFGSVSITKGR